MSASLDALSFPLDRLGEAMEVLAHRSGLPVRRSETPITPPRLDRGGGADMDDEVLDRWTSVAADVLGVEAEPVQTSYSDVRHFLRSASPAILRLPGASPRFIALLRAGQRRARVLAPDGRVRSLSIEKLRAVLCAPAEMDATPRLTRVLDAAKVRRARYERALGALLAETLGPMPLRVGWLLRSAPRGSFLERARRTGALSHAAMLIGAHLSQQLLLILAWALIGRGLLDGRLDNGWLWACALALLTIVPFRVAAVWAQGRLAIGVGGLLKQRLLYGALRLDPQVVRHEGAGAMLGRVIESEAVESLALSAGFVGLLAVFELALAAFVVAMGAGGALHTVAMVVWIAATLLMVWRYIVRRRDWTLARVAMTNDLVERMVGHRTRIAQEPRAEWHHAEDETVERYVHVSAGLDRALSRMTALVPKGWTLFSLLVLAPPFVLGEASPGALAISLGGVLFAQGALTRLAGGLAQVGGATIAWRAVAPLFHAANRGEPPGAPAFVAATTAEDRADATTSAAHRAPLVDARELTFRYRERGEPVLRGASLRIWRGDRVLLEGPSGGGKSTFASLLVGLRVPQAGVLLLDGLDRRTLGPDGWRRRIVAAPQFHENHVLTETFGFNLLMGRRWPPTEEDLRDAETVCRDLGLDEVLARMPAGLQQMVGESGWQLSHGERSRLYIARAILQGADVVVLDESFAALDPRTLERSLRCVLARAKTLVVIAHP